VNYLDKTDRSDRIDGTDRLCRMSGSMKLCFSYKYILLLLFGVGVLGGVMVRGQVEGPRSPSMPTIAPRRTAPAVLREAQAESSFVDASEAYELAGGADDFLAARADLVSAASDFLEVDLDRMTLTLYEAGEPVTTLTVLSKGRDGSWWETPTGEYRALSKVTNLYSSIGDVWMPWSVQFYGNFLIHGWPYYDDGTPVPEGYSGGCVRLSSEDAERVFRFAERGMPIVVFDGESVTSVLPELTPFREDIGVPSLTARAAYVTDLDTGEVVLDRGSTDVLPIASLTKLMTTTVASEVMYLGRSVVIAADMLTDTVQSYPLTVGARYRLFDLLYPALMQSSNGAARALRSFFDEERFVREMNAKAVSLAMDDTTFSDLSGVDGGNVSTLRDMAKLSRYIMEKRGFLFSIARGEEYRVFEDNAFFGLRNYNEFVDDPRLVGVKNGESRAAGQTLLTVWRLRDASGYERTLMMGVLGSADREADVENILAWLEEGFGLQ